MKEKQILKYIKPVLTFTLYLVDLGALFFVGNMKTWSAGAAVIAAVLALFLIYSGEKKAVPAILLACCVSEIIWVAANVYICYLMGIYLMLAAAIYLMTGFSRRGAKEDHDKKNGSIGKRIRQIAGSAAAALLLVITLFLSVTAATSVPLIKFMQAKMMNGAGNYYEPKENIITEVEGGSCISNISYGTKYPNSYLDIYLTEVCPSEKAPTYIFFHGGGYVWGDKQEGDPNGGSTKGLQWYIQQFVKEGYNVVSANYALAPDYKFPTPVLQMTEMIKFLQENAQEYHINMNDIILGGNSGGGQLAGIMACIQTNPAYAERIGIEAVLEPSVIRAVIFSSALIDNYRSYDTGDFGADFLFLQCGKAYYGWKLMENKTDAANLIDQVTDQFPPSFLSDGNTGTFYDQAFDLHEKLDSLGVTNDINWYPASEAKLGHDFETQATEYSVDNLSKIFAFLETIIQ